jgi:hypothetical protein
MPNAGRHRTRGGQLEEDRVRKRAAPTWRDVEGAIRVERGGEANLCCQDRVHPAEQESPLVLIRRQALLGHRLRADTGEVHLQRRSEPGARNGPMSDPEQLRGVETLASCREFAEELDSFG